MRIFITGASGFIGGAVVRRLKGQHELFAMARSESSAEKVRQAGATPVRCDLQGICTEDLQGCEVVVHAAAFVEPWGKAVDFWATNVTGTENMLKAAKAAGVKRFIHIGTEAVLFRGQDLNEVDETYPYPKSSPYLYSKTKKEAEIRVFKANEDDFQCLSLRPRFVWGPGDTTILKNIIELVDAGHFKWLNQGEAKTSTCFIENIAYAVDLALEKGRGGEAYFITDDEVHSMKDFITMMLKTVERDIEVGSIPGWFANSVAWMLESTWKLFGIRKKPPLTRLSVGIALCNGTLRIDKAKKELGYRPLFSVEEGMKVLAESVQST